MLTINNDKNNPTYRPCLSSSILRVPRSLKITGNVSTFIISINLSSTFNSTIFALFSTEEQYIHTDNEIKQQNFILIKHVPILKSKISQRENEKACTFKYEQ